MENCKKNCKYQIYPNFTNRLSPLFSNEKILSNSKFIIFNTCLIYFYFFERTQIHSITLMKDSILIGRKDIVLSNIVGSSGSTFKALISYNISIIVSVKDISDSKSIIEFYLR